MSQTLKDLSLLKKYGSKLGREEIAKRVIELCKEVAQEEHYKNAIKALGKFKALAAACSCDCYWSEKRDDGFYDELREAERLILKLKSKPSNSQEEHECV